MATFERTVQIGKTEAYILNVASWSNGESLQTLSVTAPDNNVTIGTYAIDGDNLSVLVTGVSKESSELHFSYTTATRSKCSTATVRVVSAC